MRKPIFLFTMFAVNMFYASLLYAESVYYVQSVKLKVFSEPSFKSKVIAEFSMGQPLSSLGKTGSWLNVKLGEIEGYAPGMLLSTHTPLNKTVVIKAEDSEIKHGVRRRASSFSSAAAARGLTKEDRKRADAEEGVDFKALNKMEALKITDDEIVQFINGGNL